MRVVCSYCRKDLGTKPPLSDASVTHGMCPDCSADFSAQWEGMSWTEYLARFDFPVILVEGDVRLVAINKPASDLLGHPPRELVGLLGGEALQCAYARLPGGCGKTTHCPACIIRNSVTRTHRTGEALTRVPATLKRLDQSLVLLISTAREGELVRVTVEPQAPPCSASC